MTHLVEQIVKGLQKQSQYGFTDTTNHYTLLRPCKWKIYNREKTEKENRTIYDEYNGYFHAFSIEAGEDGSTPVAIVEDEEGKVRCIYAEHITFTDVKGSKK